MLSRFCADSGEPDLGKSQLRLAALPTAVSCARRFVVAQLKAWSLHALADDIALVVSELVTNSVAATGSLTLPAGYAELHDRVPSTIVLRLRLTPKYMYVEVWDRSEDPPVACVPEEMGEGGRGLLLVQAYCTEWNWYASARGGKVTWARCDLPT